MSSELSSYAATESVSRGRGFAEKPHPYRTDFERDRDRIVHCSALRRLEGKTQVFTPGLDDYYRTRLTHSIEVAQIGRTIARALQLNESLTEAICLAHDFGHPPFGHAGEQVLNELMAGFGGFEHNSQTMRIVDLLEHPYPDFMGLNLMYETRLGLAKHKSRYDMPQSSLGGFAEANCSLEGQVTSVADRIAYNCHDLEDGMRAGIITAELATGEQAVALVTEARRRIDAHLITDYTIRRTRTAKTIIDTLVSDCIENSKKRIAQAKIRTTDDVYAISDDLICLSQSADSQLFQMEDFLLEYFYRHESFVEIAANVKAWLSQLFETLRSQPDLMPGYFRNFIPEQGLERTVCDYIAGMTDRFCLKMLDKT